MEGSQGNCNCLVSQSETQILYYNQVLNFLSDGTPTPSLQASHRSRQVLISPQC